MRIQFLLLAVTLSLWLAGLAGAQNDEPKTETTKPADAQAAADRYQKTLDEWKALLKDLRQVKSDYGSANDEKKAELKKRWDDLNAKGEGLIDELRATGLAAYAAAPNADRELVKFLVKLLADDVARDNYEAALPLARTLMENDCGVREVFNHAGIAAFATNQFDDAEKYLTEGSSLNVLNDKAKEFNRLLPKYKEYWAKEQELRKQEAEKDDLPRVRITTSKGPMVIELFENEAPGTVGNFVSLVEKKFYDGLTFHRVLPQFMAQGGCPKGDGTGGPGYHIKCECHQENHRNHFRGSLSMAHAGQDTGGSQFFLNFVPTESLNGKHTVFGRVIEGFDVLAKIQRRDPQSPNPAEPDKIVKMEVLRKRPGKEYVPDKAN